jgi:hypothetical protein
VEQDEPSIRLEGWRGPWSEDDRDANFKADVARHSELDPLVTLRGMSESTGIPVGALARYVLARWATEGSAGLLEIGPAMTHRLWEPVAAAEAAGDDESRLAAYHQLRQMLSWLRFPLEDESVEP